MAREAKSPDGEGTAGEGPSSYLPLRDYGAIGNNRTACLVSRSGSVDWAAFPRFDSEPVFLSLLDQGKGGFFSLAPVDPFQAEFHYEPGTNVLQHVFRTSDGSEATLTDLCPEVDSDHVLMSEIHRRLAVTRGRMRFQARFAPRDGFAAGVPTFEVTPAGVLATGEHGSCSLSTHRPVLHETGWPEARVPFALESGEEEWFVFAHGTEVVTPLEAFQPAQRLEQTLRYWRTWSRGSQYHGRWHGAVERSALALKLLFYRPTGAMVAAPTTSLPEEVGGIRNWDYRFTWVRDTALAVRSLFRLGYVQEAVNFVYWLLSVLERDRDRIRILYSVDGSSPPRETEHGSLDGYRGSRPVRVGNAAHEQVQHDIFGNVLDVANLLDLHGGVVSVGLWRELRHLVNRVVEVWREPDQGIWEVRGPPQHFVYSKVMCWVALDRGIALGERLGMVADYPTWEKTRNEIREDVLSRGLAPDGRAFAWYYGAPSVDASLLRLPVLGFVPADDPRMVATAERVETELRSGPFLYRYRIPDGLPGKEGFFLPCSFWLVEYYTLRGELSRARSLLERLLEQTGPLGLLPEEMAPDGTFLGNFPQAFSHLALLLAATRLHDSLDRPRTLRRRPKPALERASVLPPRENTVMNW